MVQGLELRLEFGVRVQSFGFQGFKAFWFRRLQTWQDLAIVGCKFFSLEHIKAP